MFPFLSTKYSSAPETTSAHWRRLEAESPEDDASLPEKVFFQWPYCLFTHPALRTKSEEFELPNLPVTDQPERLQAEFQKLEFAPTSAAPHINADRHKASWLFAPITGPKTLLFALLFTIQKQVFMRNVGLSLWHNICLYMFPILLQFQLDAAAELTAGQTNSTEEQWLSPAPRLFFGGFAAFFFLINRCFTGENWWWTGYRTGLNVRSVLSSAVFSRKILHSGSASSSAPASPPNDKNSYRSDVQNLMTTDVAEFPREWVFHLTWQVFVVFYMPVLLSQISSQVGPLPTFAGMVLLITITTVEGSLSAFVIAPYYKTLAEAKDRRIALLREFVQNVRLIRGFGMGRR